MTRALHLCLGLVLVAACGGDDGGGGDDAPEIDAAVIDADPNAPDAPVVPPDGAPGVVCGDETCDEATEECCVQGASASCVPTGTCPGQTIGCDGPEDCELGQVCCVGQDGAGCVAANACAVVVCHDTTDCPDPGDQCCDLPFGDICAPSCQGP